MGANKADRVKRYTATATILYQLDSPEKPAPDGPKALPLPEAANIRRQLLSEQNLDRVAGQLGVGQTHVAGADDSTREAAIDRIRRDLRVTVGSSSSPDQLRIAVTYSDQNAGRVVRLVDALAHNYATDARAALAEAALQKYRKARDEAERARREFSQAKARLDEFLNSHLARQQALAQRSAGRGLAPSLPETESRGPEGVEPPALKAMVDPRRAELETELAELDRQRTQLLLERTPLHPEVQSLDAQIARLRESLQTLPVPAANGLSKPSPPEGELPQLVPGDGPPQRAAEVPPDQIAVEYAKAFEAFQAHKQAVDQAGQDFDRLYDLEHRAWEEQFNSPSIQQLLDGPRPVCQPVDYWPRYLLLVVLGASTAAGAGVGLISSGLGVDTPLKTAARVQRALSVPIVGMIPAVGPLAANHGQRRSGSAGRLAKLLCGVALIAACFGLLPIAF